MQNKNDSNEPLTDREFDSLLRQWQVCVESADSVSRRRDTINGFFATLSVAMVTSATALWGNRAIPLLLVGCTVCIAWLLYIWSLKKLNTAKFSVIQELESKLPARPFADEWGYLNSCKYAKGTTIERVLPVSFLVLYVAMFVLLALGGE